jgi:hypothetical protein
MTTSPDHGHEMSTRDQRRELALPSVLTLGPRTRRIRGPLALALGSIAFAFFSVRGLWNDGMLAFGDLPRFPTEPSVFVDGFREAWSDRGLGGVGPSLPWVLVFASLLTLTGGDAPLAQQLAMTLWIPVAFCGMAYFCRRFMDTSWWLAALGGLLYVATPVSIGLFVGGASGLVWAYAFLPLVLAGAEAVRRSTDSNLAWIALPAALLAATSPELLVVGFLVAVIWLAIGRDREPFLLVALIGLALATMAMLPALVGRGAFQLSDALIEKMTVDFQWTYSEVTPGNLFRLAGNHGDPMHALGYNDASTWGYAGYLVIAALAVGLLLRRRGDLLVVRLVALAAVVFAALLGIAWVTRTRPETFADFPVLFVLRNPGKLMMLLTAAIVPAAIYGIHRLFQVFPQHREILRFVVAAGLVAYLGGYAGPALSGDWGVEEVRGSAYEADAALFASARFVANQEENAPGRYRAAWLPFDHTAALNLEWIAPRWANEPVPEARDPAVEDSIALFEEALAERDPRHFHAIADRASVRYVILRRGADLGLRSMFAIDPRMELVHRGRGFVVWRNSAAMPRIRQFTGVKAVVMPEAERQPVRYRSAPILRLTPNVLKAPSSWTTHGTRGFSQTGGTVRARTMSTRWPMLARRVEAAPLGTYVLTAEVRTRRAADAHLKILWFRTAADPEGRALDQDFTQPVLSGTRGWTRVSATVVSPRDARFGEVQFLAGRRPPESQRPAESWIRNLRLHPVFISDVPSNATEGVSEVVQHIGTGGYEIVDAERLPPEAVSETALPIDGVVVNPTPGARMPEAIRGVLPPARTEIVSRAETALRPLSGGWQRLGDSAAVVSARGTGVLPLGVVPANRYTITLTGCGLASGSTRIASRGRLFERSLTGPARGCGQFTSQSPVRLSGRSALRFTLRRNAALAAAHLVPAGRRPVPEQDQGLQVTGADTASPGVTGQRSAGIVLADSYHRGWETAGSGSEQLRAFPGFNAFALREPAELNGLNFAPQRDRNVLLVVGGLGWVAILVLLLFRGRPSPGRTARKAPGGADA